jgi:membrane-anchored glycerophosphoryl diester phosphodiesterase (GDPDase)
MLYLLLLLLLPGKTVVLVDVATQILALPHFIQDSHITYVASQG